MVLQNPTVDTAVFEVARGGILREGLGYDRNDVAVVTNVTGDHLGLGGIDSIGQLANVKGVVVEAVPRSGTAVLNADDSHVYRMGRHCAGRVVLFSMATAKGEDGFDRVDGHTGRGGAAFCLEPTSRGRADRAPPRVADDAGAVHPPHPGHVRRPGADERRERAGGGRRGVGRRAPTCTTSARACGPSRRRSSRRPAGSTCVDVGGVRVVIDYCHNVDGMRQLADFVDRMMVEAQTKAGPDRRRVDRAAATGRAIGVLGIPGDRRDEDQREYGAIAAGAFDEIIVREDKNLRGRAPGETAANVIEGVREAKAAGTARATRSEKVLDEMTAVRAGPPPGDPGRPRRLLRRRRGRRLSRGDGRRRRTSRGGTAFADPGELTAPDGLGRGAVRLRPPRPLLQPRHQLGQLGRDVDRPRPEAPQQLEHAVALLVAHQHDDPRRVGPAAVRPGAGRRR